MPFGKRLKEARLALNMTQEDLAEAVGVTKGAIGNYESEVSSPKEPILIELMKVLGVDANYLYQDYMKSDQVLTSTEHRIVKAYRAASPDTQAAVRNVLGVKEEKKDSAAGRTA